MSNRVVQGRMVTPEKLAELIEGDSILEAESITNADRDCPECGGDVISVGYMPSVTEFITGYKCQECDWSAKHRDRGVTSRRRCLLPIPIHRPVARSFAIETPLSAFRQAPDARSRGCGKPGMATDSRGLRPGRHSRLIYRAAD